MAANAKALNTLLRVKRRRVEQAGAHVKACQQAVREREPEAAQAREQEQACRDAEQACLGKIASMCREGFLPSDLIAMQMVHDGLKAKTAAAVKATAAADQQVQAAHAQLQQARRALQKAESVVEFLEKRREELLREIENARDELQDEESEEAAVARMLAAAVKTAEAAEAT